jgi:hypothetical protein
MCAEFEQALEDIGSWAETIAKDKVGPVNANIERTEQQIAKMKTQTVPIERDPVEEREELGHARAVEAEQIRFLEVALRDKNRDRLTSLLEMRQQLTDCVATLEQLDRAHSVRIDELKAKIEAVDERYQKELTRETEKHKRDVTPVKRKLEETERRALAAQKEVTKLQQDHLGQVLEVGQSRDEIRMELRAVSSRPAPSRKDVSLTFQLQAKFEEKKEELARREGVLQDERRINQAIKREVSRLRDEARIAHRRAALNV